jgi:glycosyltransferase involved in cell wall biosynthesis
MAVMLQIIQSSTNGGAEKHTRLITKAFRAQGIAITLVYPPGPYAAEFATLRRIGVECIEFDLKKNLLYSILFVRKLIVSRRISCIHSHMHWADFIATLARIGRRDICHFSTIHYLPIDIRNQGFLKQALAYSITLLSFHLMHRVFAVSASVAVRGRRAFLLPSSKVVMTLNSIDFSELTADPRAVNAIKRGVVGKSNTRILLSVGELCERKGQKYLIKALHLFQRPSINFKLVLLGNGEQKKELMSMVDCYGLKDCVVFAGYQPAIADWLAAADIYLQLSLIDPMPRAMLEAMYLKLPVIASSIPTLSEVVKNRVTGMLVNPTAPSEIKRAIEFLLRHREVGQGLGRAAHEFVRQNCAMETMAARIMANLPERFTGV